LSVATLLSYGLKPIGTLRIVNGAFKIDITELGEAKCCVYAFVVGDEIVRVGSSKDRLAKRFRRWESDVTNALQGLKSDTPPEEAKGWKDLLSKAVGRVFARPGTLVTTPVGEINTYLAEETALIAKHTPRFCRRS
jgi:hypothetical protein